VQFNASTDQEPRIFPPSPTGSFPAHQGVLAVPPYGHVPVDVYGTSQAWCASCAWWQAVLLLLSMRVQLQYTAEHVADSHRTGGCLQPCTPVTKGSMALPRYACERKLHRELYGRHALPLHIRPAWAQVNGTCSCCRTDRQLRTHQPDGATSPGAAAALSPSFRRRRRCCCCVWVQCESSVPAAAPAQLLLRARSCCHRCTCACG
jgi:hypothetical protein